MRCKFHITKVYFFALVALIAILSGAFSFAVFNSNLLSPAEMVYCPLTKKLQPINPPSVSNAFSLNEICATDAEKIRLTSAIVKNLKLQFTNFTANNFEDLAFDFWQKGKTAFDSLPNAPNLPEKLTVKNFFSPTNSGDNFSFKIVWKTTEKFAFQAQPRPPTAIDFPEFNFEIVPKLKRISRRIAPRAPPVFV